MSAEIGRVLPIPSQAQAGDIYILQTAAQNIILIHNGIGWQAVFPAGGAGAGGDVNLVTVSGLAISEGQKTMVSSLPVVLPSDQSDIPVNLDKIGTVALAFGQAVMASSIPVVLSSDQTLATAQSSPPALADGTRTRLFVDADGSIRVNPAALSYVSDSVTAYGSLSSFLYTSALNATKQQISAIPNGGIRGWHIDNSMNSVKTYIQFFNKLASAVIVGTTPPDFTLTIAANAILDDPSFSGGLGMPVGITFAATTTPTGSTSPVSNLIATVWYN